MCVARHGLVLVALAVTGLALAVTSANARPQVCPGRPSPNWVVRNPADQTATNGTLHMALTLRSQEMAEFPLKFCYLLETPSLTAESPTLRLSPGETLELALTNRLTYVPPAEHPPANSPAPHDACGGGSIASTATNLAFDGLTVPVTCHQGEATRTTIENTDPPFTYRFQIPADAPPGLNLYRPGLVASAGLQINGGASGAVIIAGMEKAKPEITGLPERILIFRRQFDEPDTPDDATWISLNYQPVGYRHLAPPVIQMKPGAREFWRVANATPETFLALQLVFATTAQPLRLIALDGVPTRASTDTKTIELPPGGRAEFIVTGPSKDEAARLIQTEFDTGPTGAEQPIEQLANIVATADALPPSATAPSAKPLAWRSHVTQVLADRTNATQRHLFFAEAANGTNGPTRFLLTVEGQTPKIFDRAAPPAMTTHVGATEDWVIANHSGEAHALHAQGLHFLLLAVRGHKLPNPEWRDTATVPAWEGKGAYPTVTLRMDFTDPRSAGGHIIACWDPRHAAGGMMTEVQVDAK